MKGKLYTFNEYFMESQIEGESFLKWFKRMAEKGWLTCTQRSAYRCIEEDGYYVFKSGKELIHLKTVCDKKSPIE